MSSFIDFSKPIFGTPDTESTRENFRIASTEITELQERTKGAPFLSLDDGGIMRAPIELVGNASRPREPVTLQQLSDALAMGNGGGGGGTGLSDAPTTGMFFARGGGFVSLGNDWSSDPLFTGLTIAASADDRRFGLRTDGTFNRYDLTDDGSTSLRFNRSEEVLEFLLREDSIFSLSATDIAAKRPVILPGDATQPLQSVPLQQMQNTLTGFPTIAEMNLALAGYLPLSGGTLTPPGDVTTPGNVVTLGDLSVNGTMACNTGWVNIATTGNIFTNSGSAASGVYGAYVGGGSPGVTGWAFSFYRQADAYQFFIYVDAISDARVKENIVPSRVDALDIICKVPVSEFDYKAGATPDGKPQHQRIGIVTQHIEDLIPEAVSVAPPGSGDHPAGPPDIPDDAQRLIQQNFVPYLVKAVQQLKAEVSELRSLRLDG